MHKNSQDYSQFASPNASRESNKILFSDKTVKYLQPKEKREIYWFEGMIGFGLRITPKGSKSFIYSYRHDGHSRMMTLGRYPKLSLAEAREEYAKSARKFELGEDPAESKVISNITDREMPTVREFVKQYLKHCRMTGKKTWKEDERVFKKDILPILGRKKLDKVAKREIRHILNKIVERGSAGMADHTLAYVRRLFNVAEEWDLITYNPCRGLKKTQPKRSRERVLSTKEIWKFWHGLDDCDLFPVLRLALKFVLCTYTRPGETIDAMWSHIDRKHGLWVIPESMTKNGSEHRLPINDMALKIIDEVFPLTGASDFVFGSTRQIKPSEVPETNLKKLTRCALSQGLRLNRKKYIDIDQRFTPHDLRRTAATITVALGCPVDWVERLLNHTKGTLIRVYNRYSYELEKRTGSEILGYAINRIVSCDSLLDVPSLEELRREVNAKGLLYKHFSPKETVQPSQRFEGNISCGITYKISGLF